MSGKQKKKRQQNIVCCFRFNGDSSILSDGKACERNDILSVRYKNKGGLLWMMYKSKMISVEIQLRLKKRNIEFNNQFNWKVKTKHIFIYRRRHSQQRWSALLFRTFERISSIKHQASSIISMMLFVFALVRSHLWFRTKGFLFVNFCFHFLFVRVCICHVKFDSETELFIDIFIILKKTFQSVFSPFLCFNRFSDSFPFITIAKCALPHTHTCHAHTHWHIDTMRSLSLCI